MQFKMRGLFIDLLLQQEVKINIENLKEQSIKNYNSVIIIHQVKCGGPQNRSGASQ